ncbi:MAG: hypothetical protein ABIP89_18700, partial [Polyangiaceae bacterium]
TAAFLAAALSVSVASAQDAPSADDCIRSWGAARFNGSGYTHRIYISNVCPAAASCIVSTDVNPQPERVVAPPMSDIDVTTFLDSPSSVFVGRVVCTMPAAQ